MTPKEKAKELLWKYLPILEGWKYEDSNTAKKCALIAVDEKIKTAQEVFEHCFNHDFWNGNYDFKDMEKYISDLKELKQEIENL